MKEFDLAVLNLKWTTSKARESYGYNICSLIDTKTQKRYKTCGGGYDMVGTVFGQWLWDNFRDKIMVSMKPHDYNNKDYESRHANGVYGFVKHGDKYGLDGACGMKCMEEIAGLIGLHISRVADKKGLTISFVVRKK